MTFSLLCTGEKNQKIMRCTVTMESSYPIHQMWMVHWMACVQRFLVNRPQIFQLKGITTTLPTHLIVPVWLHYIHQEGVPLFLSQCPLVSDLHQWACCPIIIFTFTSIQLAVGLRLALFPTLPLAIPDSHPMQPQLKAGRGESLSITTILTSTRTCSHIITPCLAHLLPQGRRPI